MAWALYDFASAPFTTLIVTFIFPAYFGRAIVGDEMRGQVWWGYGIGAAGLVIAIASPVLGAIADAGGRRKPWLASFSSLCIVSSALLWFARPSPGLVVPVLVVVSLANIGFEFAVAFNNAALPDLAPKDHVGRWSGWSWALSYCGGLAALAIALALLIGEGATWLGLDRSSAEQIRAVGPLAAIWYAAFAWPRFVYTPDHAASGLTLAAAVGQGLATLRQTLAQLPRQANLARFLLAQTFYADALLGIFSFGGIYAAGVFGMTIRDVVTFGILLNVTAGVGAFAFAWVDDWIGSRRTILLSLAGLIASSLAAVLAGNVSSFWMAGAVLGVFVGPVQSSSRSLMARMAPAGKEAEYFGLFALSRRATAFLAPVLVGATTAVSGSQRAGLLSLLVLLLAGAVLLLTVSDVRATGVRQPKPSVYDV